MTKRGALKRNTNNWYLTNETTGETKWEEKKGDKKKKKAREKKIKNEVEVEVTVREMPAEAEARPAKLDRKITFMPEGWSKLFTDEGKGYYVNPIGNSQWEKPPNN